MASVVFRQEIVAGMFPCFFLTLNQSVLAYEKNRLRLSFKHLLLLNCMPLIGAGANPQKKEGKHMHKKLLVLALVMAFVLVAGAALADEPSGTISMEVVSTTVGVGPTWGQAVLTFQGKTHLFKVRGFKMLSVGREKLSVDGDVYKLANLSDLTGTYRKVPTAGLTFIANPSDMVLQNDKGVTINVMGKQKGISLDLAQEGLTIEPAR